MPRRRRYDAAFVPARQSLWQSLLHWLFPPRVQRVRTPPARPMPEYWNQTPPQVWHWRKRATEARQLLRRHTEGKPVSRRAWVADGHSQTSWKRARLLLIAAKVIDREGRLLYLPRDAQLRLDVYLDKLEAKVRAESRFIAP